MTSQSKDVESARASLSEAIELTSKHGALRNNHQRKASLSGRPSKSPDEIPKLPSVSGERVIRALKRAGFVELRQRGSQVSLERRIGEQVFRTVVPYTSNSQNARSDILKQCGLKLEEFLSLL